jgi:DNA-binding NtrC family response regulator
METACEAVPTLGGRWTMGAGLGAMEDVRARAMRAARARISVLLLGETGVGKEVLARQIHEASPRAARPFVAINCGGMSETLLDSELFGHERGAFTDAVAARKGLFEVADGGTLFLDELGEMPLGMQAKLLRFLDSREVRPLGGVRSRVVDVRFVAATNVDLHAAVARGDFRSDLMYRLNTLTLCVPPLRERRDELDGLVETLLARVCRENERAVPVVSGEARARLAAHDWPGNVRELRNVLELAVVLCDGGVVEAEHLQIESRKGRHLFALDGGVEDGALALGDGGDERETIVRALDLCGRNQTKAARLLGISRRKLITKLDLYKVPRPVKSYARAVS